MALCGQGGSRDGSQCSLVAGRRATGEEGREQDSDPVRLADGCDHKNYKTNRARSDGNSLVVVADTRIHEAHSPENGSDSGGHSLGQIHGSRDNVARKSDKDSWRSVLVQEGASGIEIYTYRRPYDAGLRRGMAPPERVEWLAPKGDFLLAAASPRHENI